MVKKRETLLAACDRIAGRANFSDLDDLEGLTASLRRHRRKKRSSRLANNKVLYRSLAVALTLRYCGTGSIVRKQRLSKLLDTARIDKIRANTNPAIPIVKACMPGRHRRDYHRYAAAVDKAAKRRLSPSKFFKALKKAKGGMTGFIGADRA